MRPEDVADLLATLEVDRQLEVFAILSEDYPDAAGEVLTALEPAPRLALLERLTPEQTAFILERVPVDDAVFVVESLPPALQERVLALVDLKDLTDVQTQLAYPESSAGRLMDTEFFALPEGETVRAAIAAIQEQRDVEMIFYLYVVDRDNHLVGVTSLRQVLLSKPDQTLADIMQRSVIKARVDTDQSEVAELAARYDLLAIPVVDDQNRMAGIVTVDDIIDVVKEEATDDLFKVAGTSEDELIYEERTLKVAGLRLKSLLVSLAGLLVTGLLLEFFQVRFLEAMFLLAFVPVIMGLGGSIGGQASAVTLRGLATGRFGGEEGGIPRRSLPPDQGRRRARTLLRSPRRRGRGPPEAEPLVRPGRRGLSLLRRRSRLADRRLRPLHLRPARPRPRPRRRPGGRHAQRHHRHPHLLRPRPTLPRATCCADPTPVPPAGQRALRFHRAIPKS